MFFNIAVESDGRIIDRYDLLRYSEKTWREHSFLPMGRGFLRGLSNKSGGEFITASGDLSRDLKKISVRKPVIVTAAMEEENPLYKSKAVLVLFLYLILASFYLKSKYYV